MKFLTNLYRAADAAAFLFRLIGFAVILTAVSLTGNAQTKKLTQRCSGSTSSAKIEITKKGDISIAKCPGRTTTIDGSTVSAGSFRYIAKVSQFGTSAPTPPSGSSIYVNTINSDIASADYEELGVYTFHFSGDGLPAGHRYVRTFTTMTDVACTVSPTAISGTSITVVCFNPTTGSLTDLNSDSDRQLFLDIEVFP